MVAGLAGGIRQPDPISCQELRAWAALHRLRLTPWELGVLLEMDRCWLSGHNSKGKNTTPGRCHQALGEYCNEQHLEQCRKELGAGLAQACATCPN